MMSMGGLVGRNVGGGATGAVVGRRVGLDETRETVGRPVGLGVTLTMVGLVEGNAVGAPMVGDVVGVEVGRVEILAPIDGESVGSRVEGTTPTGLSVDGDSDGRPLAWTIDVGLADVVLEPCSVGTLVGSCGSIDPGGIVLGGSVVT